MRTKQGRTPLQNHFALTRPPPTKPWAAPGCSIAPKEAAGATGRGDTAMGGVQQGRYAKNPRFWGLGDLAHGLLSHEGSLAYKYAQEKQKNSTNTVEALQVPPLFFIFFFLSKDLEARSLMAAAV